MRRFNTGIDHRSGVNRELLKIGRWSFDLNKKHIMAYGIFGPLLQDPPKNRRLHIDGNAKASGLGVMEVSTQL